MCQTASDFALKSGYVKNQLLSSSFVMRDHGLLCRWAVTETVKC